MSSNPQNCRTALKRAVNYPQVQTTRQKCSYETVQLQVVNTFVSVCSDTAVYKHTSRVTGIFFSSLGFCQMGKSCSSECPLKERSSLSANREAQSSLSKPGETERPGMSVISHLALQSLLPPCFLPLQIRIPWSGKALYLETNTPQPCSMYI